MAHRRVLFGTCLSCYTCLSFETSSSQGDDYTCLPVVENYEYLRNIHVPDGIYSSAKGNIGRVTRALSEDDNDTERYSNSSTPGWISPSWPPSITTAGLNGPYQRPLSSSSSSSGSPVSTHHFTTAPFSPEAPTLHRDGSLPRLASIAPVQLSHPLSSLQPPGSRHNTSYAPLTSEDRRALNSFRVVL